MCSWPLAHSRRTATTARHPRTGEPAGGLASARIRSRVRLTSTSVWLRCTNKAGTLSSKKSRSQGETNSMNWIKLINSVFHRRAPGVVRGRARTRDYGSTAIAYRMQAGFPGDVNRMHPASIEPCLIDASAPPTAYGQAVLVDGTTQGVRPLVAGDQALTDVYG